MARKQRLDVPIKFTTNAEQIARLEAVEDSSGHTQSDIIRACLEIGLPLLGDKPGMIPVCQPGVLRTTP